MAPLELAGTSLMEALGCAAVCLQLWHCVPDENCVLDNLLSIYEQGFRCSIFPFGSLVQRTPPTPVKVVQSIQSIMVSFALR